jgi:hypothetical protein
MEPARPAASMRRIPQTASPEGVGDAVCGTERFQFPKGVTVKFRISILALAVAVVAAFTAGSALAKNSIVIAFTGTYRGQASTQINGNVATIAAHGTGKGTLIGGGSITGQGTGDTSQQPCIPFGGTGTIKGAAGTIVFKLVTGASGCGDEGGHTFSVTAHLAVVKATGKLLKAKGTLKLTGVYSHDDGSFSVKVFGKLTK